jgi:hypothetical protein
MTDAAYAEAQGCCILNHMVVENGCDHRGWGRGPGFARPRDFWSIWPELGRPLPTPSGPESAVGAALGELS